ncbi:hypothetical protein [Bacillus wiedmannii]|uniref:hypothetical protein n=1 Tax=Bacillus wiedmannii TaxID=1890302 RepID=UPI000992D019|nr:hypothetical protein [Bacillus wiedmannii]OOR22798.1 hypothetical protein BW893_28755 [Bacillus wiedmannii]PEO19875.1 hypothetical protein CN546_08035 [Bacillus wiedmannii]
MKKLLAVFFALALAFTAIGSTPAMALGNGNAHLFWRDGHLNNHVFGKKPLLNSPSNPNPVGYVADQDVDVRQAWFIINTSLGPKWIGFNEDSYPMSVGRYEPAYGKIHATEYKIPLYNNPGDPRVVGYVASQWLTATQAWFLIRTSLGEKWIGYNMDRP